MNTPRFLRRTIGLALLLLANFAQSQPLDVARVQQRTLADFASCAPGVNDRARALISDPSKLPPWLRPADLGMPAMPMPDVAASVRSNPKVMAQMRATAEKLGVPVEQLLDTLLAQDEDDEVPAQRTESPQRSRQAKPGKPSNPAVSAAAQSGGKQDAIPQIGTRVVGFMTNVGARVDLVNQLGDACDKACEEMIASNIATSIAFWRNACHYCTDDFLSVVRIGQKTWVDARIAAWIDDIVAGKRATFPLMGRVSAVSSRAVGPDGAPLPPKAAVDAAAEFLVLRPVASEVADKFCARPRVPGRGAMQTANALLDAYVCNAGIDAPSPPRTAQMRVSLLKDGTGCDEAGERYLACGFRDSSVEISFAQARYSFLEPLSGSRIWIGKVGRREFDGLHVLIHEVGHWFGLSHTDLPTAAQINDIMQPALDTPTCASELSIWLINNMSDQNYQNRFRGAEKQGLKAPRP